MCELAASPSAVSRRLKGSKETEESFEFPPFEVTWLHRCVYTCQKMANKCCSDKSQADVSVDIEPIYRNISVKKVSILVLIRQRRGCPRL